MVRRDGPVRPPVILGALLSGVLTVSACNPSGTDPVAESTDPAAATTAGSSSGERATTTWNRYVVVLPFENLGEDEEAALVAGLTEEIRGRIAALPSVVVVSADQVGLNVLSDVGLPRPDIERYFDLILEGSILWAAGEEIQTRIRIAERGWEAAVWNREWRDPRSVEALLATQSKISTEVRRILDLPDSDVGSPERTDSIEAYEAFLRGLSGRLKPPIGHQRSRRRFDGCPGLLARIPASPWLMPCSRSAIVSSIASGRTAAPSVSRRREQPSTVRPSSSLAWPGLAEAQRALGLYHLATGDDERALEALGAAALQMPEDSRTLAALGLVHWNRGELEPCEERWKKALRLSANGDLAFRLGTLAERLGDGEGALRWFEYAERLGHRKSRDPS